MQRIAEFLAIPIDEMKWDAILEHCSFDYMKQHATKSVPLAALFGTAALRRLSIRALTVDGATS